MSPNRSFGRNHNGQSMKLFVKKNLKHIIIMAITIAFFFVSPWVQQRLALRASALEIVSDPLPSVTQDARMYVDKIRLINVREEVYQMDGWGFLILDSKIAPPDYERTILLISNRYVFAIPAADVPRKDVQTAFEKLGLNLNESGFAGKFQNNALPKGDYMISLLFTLPDGTQTRYDSKFELHRTYNSIYLVEPDN